MSELAQEYAGALFALSEEDGISDELREQVACTAALFAENRDLTRLLSSPSLTLAEKQACVTRAFGAVHPHLLHFLLLLTERGYAQSIPACLDEYVTLWRRSRGVAVAVAESAVPLTDKQKKALTAQLSHRYGKTIELIERVNPALIGGVRVTVEGELLDNSIRARLDGVRARLSETVL